jgi:hypothetical protein
VRNRAAGTNTWASPSAGAPNGTFVDLALSTNGATVAYTSNASNLVANDTVGTIDVFRFTSGDAVATRVSQKGDGTPANGPSVQPFLTGDGARVAFSSQATNLVAGDTNGSMDGFVWQLASTPATTVAVKWTAEEAARVQQLATRFGISPEQVHSDAVYFVAFLIALGGPQPPTPASLPPAGNAVTYNITWPTADLPVLDSVGTRYVLNRSDSHRLGVYFLSFLVALQGG